MQLEGRVSTRGQKTSESFLVAYSNYQIVQKSVEGRLAQQIVRNDSLLMTLFDCFGPLLELPKYAMVLKLSGSKMKWIHASSFFNNEKPVQKNYCALRRNFLTLTLYKSL